MRRAAGMAAASPRALLLLVVLGLAGSCAAVETSLKSAIYTDVLSLPCVRLLNQEGVIGCQAKKAHGPLYAVNTTRMLDTFLGDVGLQGKFMLMMPHGLFTSYVIAWAEPAAVGKRAERVRLSACGGGLYPL